MTDVFILQIHFLLPRKSFLPTCNGFKRKECALTDIEATVKAHMNVVLHLLAVHCISGCDTVAEFFGIGKGISLRAINADFH